MHSFRLLKRELACALASGFLLIVPLVRAQTLRGVVLDAGGRGIPGAVLQLIDSVSRTAARGLSNERGEYSLTAPAAGTYRLRSLRIGFRPWISTSYVLSAGTSRVERITLANIAVALDTVRVAARNTCKVDADSGAMTFAVWEQARTALVATDVTSALRTLRTTTISHNRTLDADGRRTLHQTSQVQSHIAQQPWLAQTPEALHTLGYVIRPEDGSTTYYAPGLETLTSNTFLEDHCFRVVRDGNRIGLTFEPSRDRRSIPELEGTLWLSRETAALQSMRYHYVNLPRELDSQAGGELEFARLSNGAWAISRWDIRMPVFERRTRSAAFGGSDLHIAEMRAEGGELILATIGVDTLWSQPPRVLRGIVRDSVSGSPLANARVSIRGSTLSSASDVHGRFSISGALPGEYVLEVHTASLDSVSALQEAPVEFLGDDRETDIRVPTGAQIISSICSARSTTFDNPAVLLGVIHSAGTGALPADVRLSVRWSRLTAERLTSPDIRSAHGVSAPDGRAQERIAPVRNLVEVRAAPDGAFRACGVPANHDLVVEAESDSGYADAVVTKIPPSGRFGRVELTMHRTTGLTSAFVGTVYSDTLRSVLPGVEVSIGDIGRSVQTDEHGAFRIVGIPAGMHQFSLRRLGYSALDTTIMFGAGQTVRRTIFLDRAVTLAEVHVRERLLPASFDDHMKVGLGVFYTRAQLDSATGRPLAGFLAQTRGMRVVSGTGRTALPTSSRRPDCVSVGKVVCQYQDYGAGGPVLRCWAKVYLDGHLMNGGAVTDAANLREYAPEQLEAIEWYPNSASVPMEYSTLNDNCGVLVLWTRKSR